MRIRSDDTDTSEVINMSSLLDVLFILIIFFLVTTTFKQLEDDHRVDLPVDQRNQALSNKGTKYRDCASLSRRCASSNCSRLTGNPARRLASRASRASAAARNRFRFVSVC